MGLTFSQLDISGEEVDQLIFSCVVKREWFKPDIVDAVSFSFFIKYDEPAMYNTSAERIVKEFVTKRFLKLQRFGKLKFNKKKSKWDAILNAEFPTLRDGYGWE